MSADFDHYVTTHGRSNGRYAGSTRTYRAGSHRVEHGALVLVGHAEQTGPGYAGPDSAADFIIIPLDTIDLAIVDVRERPEE
jgi:hypothetical protein